MQTRLSYEAFPYSDPLKETIPKLQGDTVCLNSLLNFHLTKYFQETEYKIYNTTGHTRSF
jgi:hypothetical protein